MTRDWVCIPLLPKFSMWPWADHFSSLGLRFLICKMRAVISSLPTHGRLHYWPNSLPLPLSVPFDSFLQWKKWSISLMHWLWVWSHNLLWQIWWCGSNSEPLMSPGLKMHYCFFFMYLHFNHENTPWFWDEDEECVKHNHIQPRSSNPQHATDSWLSPT